MALFDNNSLQNYNSSYYKWTMIKKGKKEEFLIKIFSLNTFGLPFLSPQIQERYEAISDFLEKSEVDIINFQEVFMWRNLKTLIKNLPSYPYISFKKSLFGPKRGLVTFSKYKIKSNNFIPFPRSLSGLRYLATAPSIFFTNGFIISHFNSLPLIVINTHISPNLSGDWSKKDDLYLTQKNELKKLSTFIKKLSLQKNPVVLTGDFNIPKKSVLYKYFISTANVKDLFFSNTEPSYHQEFLPSNRKAECVDYVFYYGNIKEIKRKHLLKEKCFLSNGKKSYLSDHIGLFADLGIKNNL